MSDQEQDAALLRLVKQRSEAKKRRTLLESELSSAGRALFNIASALKDIRTLGEFNNVPEAILPEIDRAPEICSLGKIRALLVELRDLQQTILALDRDAIALGVD